MYKLFFSIFFIYLCFACHSSQLEKENRNTSSQALQKDSSQNSNKIAVDTVNKKIKKLDSIIHKHNIVAELWHRKALLFLEIKNEDSAIFCLQKAIKLDTKNLESVDVLSYIYAEAGNEKCIPLVTRIIKSKNKNRHARAYYTLGVFYSVKENKNKAILNFDNAIKYDWTFLSPYLEKGILLLKNKELEKALKIFLLAVQANNKSAEAYYWIGRTFEEQKKIEKAKYYYKLALLYDNHFNIARNRLKQLEK